MITKEIIEAHMAEQAAWHAKQSHLMIDYYRARRRMAVKLPATEMAFFEGTLQHYRSGYPWPIWFMFALENRIGALSWAGEWQDNAEWRQLAERDLAAMGSWPVFRQYDKPDLGVGLSGRLMWYALQHWTWLSDSCKQQLQKACTQLVEEALVGLELYDNNFDSLEDILAHDLVGKDAMLLHNIPLIGAIGAALAAACVDHPRIEEFHHWVEIRTLATLEALPQGFTEGVAYDGFVMDFVYCWVQVLDEERRNRVLQHPSISLGLQQCFALTCPGKKWDVAQIDDVESLEWPYHASAQAYLFSLIGGADRAHYLQHYHPQYLRLLPMALIRDQIDMQSEAPQAGAWEAIHGHVLRGGWEDQDVALVASISNCSMGHIHYAAGSIVIGHRGFWLLDDAGYQQYLKTSERDFTMGPNSHNAPVINGQAQSKRGVQVLAHDGTNLNAMHMAFDMTANYDESLSLTTVQRDLWLLDNRFVVCADSIASAEAIELQYNWHAHVDAAWSVSGRSCGIHIEDRSLFIQSPDFADDEFDFLKITRLRGSRGQQTWQPQTRMHNSVVWWVFDTQADTPALTVAGDKQSAELAGHQLQLYTGA